MVVQSTFVCKRVSCFNVDILEYFEVVLARGIHLHRYVIQFGHGSMQDWLIFRNSNDYIDEC